MGSAQRLPIILGHGSPFGGDGIVIDRFVIVI